MDWARMEVGESVGFADTGDLVLNLGWQSALQLSAEDDFAPLDMSGKEIEVNQVLHYALVFTHVEIFKVSLCFAFGVMWSKVLFLTPKQS